MNALRILVLLLLLLPAAAGACQITWDTPSAADWLEGIRFYKEGAEVGTAAPTPPTACSAVGVVPCIACSYTATFYRGGEESPPSPPLTMSIGIPQGGRIELAAQ